MNTHITQTAFSPQFRIEITQDGSPTLQQTNEAGEMMHHSDGAASETKYIYKSVIEHSLKLNPQFKTCVVGLGLGYIEISWAMALISQGLKPNKQLSLVSYEISEDLINSYKSWLNANSTNSSIYSQIVKCLDSTQNEVEVKNILKSNTLRGDLIKNYDQDNSINLICFDAFSRKASEELWTPEFLTQFFKKTAHEDCVLTTYACTANLKRALKENGFSIILRPSFNGKRDATLALKGHFMSLQSFYQTF